MLRFITDLVGIDKVCLGTDYPFPLGEDIPGELIKNSGFTAEEQSIMLGDSALQWLKMPKNLFV